MAAQMCLRDAVDGRIFLLPAKASHRQAAPQVGRGALPGAALLPGQQARHDLSQILLPGRIIQHGQQQARRIHVPVAHAPPAVTLRVRLQHDAAALVRDPGTQRLQGVTQPLRTCRRLRHTLQDADPVQQRSRSHADGRDLQPIQHGRPHGIMSGQGFQRHQAHVLPIAGHPAAFPHGKLALYEHRQSANHLLPRSLRQRKDGIQPGRLMRGRQQPGRQQRAAAVAAPTQREVIGQPLVIQVGGDLLQNLPPHHRIVQADRLAGLLLQTGIRITLEPGLYRRQTVVQPGPQVQLQPAAAGQGAGRGCHRHRRRLLTQLNQRGLLHRHWRGSHDALVHLQHVTGSFQFVPGFPGLHFPEHLARAQFGQRGRCGHLPPHLTGRLGGNLNDLRLQSQQRGTRRHLHRHRALRGVAYREAGLEAVAGTNQRRQATDQLQILRRADVRLARPEIRDAAVGYRHDPERGQRIIERHRHARLALRIELHLRLPQQQRVQQLAHRTARTGSRGAITARWQRLAPIVATPDDLHLRGGGLHPPGAARQHAFQQFPAGVGQKLQQRFVHGGHRHLGMRSRPAIGQGHHNVHLGVPPHGIAFPIGLQLHIQPVLPIPHADLGHPEAEGRLAQVHQRGRRLVLAVVLPPGIPPAARVAPAPAKEAVPGHVAQPAAQGQHTHIDVGRPAFLHLQAHRRVIALEFHHLGPDDAFTLDGHQSGCLTERHADLEARRLTWGVYALFRDDVDAVMVATPEPPLRQVGDPQRPFDHAGMALGIPGHGLKLHIPGLVQGHLAVQQSLRIALALAERAQRLRLDVVVIDVETAHDPLAAAVDGLHPGRQRQRHASPGLAIRP